MFKQYISDIYLYTKMENIFTCATGNLVLSFDLKLKEFGREIQKANT